MTVRRAGLVVLVTAIVAIGLAPFLAPNPTQSQFSDRDFAPPMRIHIRAADGFHAPFVYPIVLSDRLMREYREDRSERLTLGWFTRGKLVSIDPSRQATRGPLLLLGADALGRDTFARLLHGARLSLAVTLVGVAGALTLGALLGGLAGGLGGRTDALLMLVADFVLVLPGAYLVLALRGALPLVLTSWQIFWLMGGLFAVSGWPHVARGVRAIVAAERMRDYAEAARAAGAGTWRILLHLLPATKGFLGVEVLLLVPAMLVAEATISFLGLGFPPPAASLGTMLHEAENVNVMAQAPWLLAPAAALFGVVLGVHLVVGRRAEPALLGVTASRS
jgi:peptide/nickel transport system permease protein